MAEAQTEPAAAVAALGQEASDFFNLMKGQVRAKTEKDSAILESTLKTLCQQALSGTSVISADALRTIDQLVSAIDTKLSAQVNQILHHEDFRTMEGAWRGLSHMIFKSETDATLQIKVLNLSKKELKKQMKDFPDASFDQSPLFKKIYEEEYGVFGGNPFGLIVGDYYFDHSFEDVKTLEGMSKIAASAHAPFLTAADPNLFGLESWQELGNPRDLVNIAERNPDLASWRGLRDSEDSRYLGLCMPRFLARLPYGSKTSPVDEFAFEEDTGSADHNRYVWANSAYAMAANITRAFKEYGWSVAIRGTKDGAVTGLPVHTFPTDDGGRDMKCPTEIAITDRREAELSNCGLLPLCHKKNQDLAAFFGGQSLQKAKSYGTKSDKERAATDSAQLSARLPYMFAVCRFAHYLKCMVRDRIGTFASRSQLEGDLNAWIKSYTCDTDMSGEEQKARSPLAEAEVEVHEVPGKPGYYTSVFRLKPHYQLEGLAVSLRLVSQLKQAGG